MRWGGVMMWWNDMVVVVVRFLIVGDFCVPSGNLHHSSTNISTRAHSHRRQYAYPIMQNRHATTTIQKQSLTPPHTATATPTLAVLSSDTQPQCPGTASQKLCVGLREMGGDVGGGSAAVEIRKKSISVSVALPAWYMRNGSGGGTSWRWRC